MLREDLDGKLPHLRLTTTNRAFCASAQYLERFGTPQTPADLKKHSCLANVVMGVPERWSVLMGRTKRELKLDSRLLADNGEILRRACIDGAGIGNFYRFHVREDLRAGRLIEVLGSFQPNTNALYAILPHRQIVLPHVDAFIKFVGSVVQDAPFRQKDAD